MAEGRHDDRVDDVIEDNQPAGEGRHSVDNDTVERPRDDAETRRA